MGRHHQYYILNKDAIFKSLGTLTQLTTLKVTSFFEKSEAGPAQPSLNLPLLRELSLYITPRNQLGWELASLASTALTSLALVGGAEHNFTRYGDASLQVRRPFIVSCVLRTRGR